MVLFEKKILWFCLEKIPMVLFGKKFYGFVRKITTSGKYSYGFVRENFPPVAIFFIIYCASKCSILL